MFVSALILALCPFVFTLSAFIFTARLAPVVFFLKVFGRAEETDAKVFLCLELIHVERMREAGIVVVVIAAAPSRAMRFVPCVFEVKGGRYRYYACAKHSLQGNDACGKPIRVPEGELDQLAIAPLLTGFSHRIGWSPSCVRPTGTGARLLRETSIAGLTCASASRHQRPKSPISTALLKTDSSRTMTCSGVNSTLRNQNVRNAYA